MRWRKRAIIACPSYVIGRYRVVAKWHSRRRASQATRGIALHVASIEVDQQDRQW